MSQVSNNNMVTRKWTKPNVQSALKSLRGAKTTSGEKIFNVVKEDGVYEVKANKNNELVFSAMIGRFDYLVTFDTRLFKQK
jgi:hypothetical protein|tara:strand:+ start:1000 stop:1242 length:243 start_codon:yes stop_codon:yes gene_type:complete